MRFILGFIAVFVIGYLACPHDQNTPVTSSAILSSLQKEPTGIATCGTFGSVVSARLVNTTGPYNLYRITCTTGVTFTVGR